MKRAVILILILSLCLALCACGGSASQENPAAEKTAETPSATGTADKTDMPEIPEMPDIPEKYRDLIGALEAEDYDGALALVEAMKPAPELPPIREVTITTENFFDYFEYVELPENSKSVYIDSAGAVNNIRFDSGYYLKDGFTVAEAKQQDCAVEVGVKWKTLQFYWNKGILVDLEAHSYEATGDPRFTYKFDEMKEGTVFRPVQDGPLSYRISFYRTTLGRGGGNDTYIITDVNFVSASGTLYLYE